MGPTEAAEAVAAWHGALNAGDAERLAALSHPDVAMEGPRGATRGRKELKDWLGRANVRLEPLRWFGGSGTVVVEQEATWRDAGTGEAAGAAVVATVFALKDGLVARVFRHDDLAGALEGAGLGPPDEIRQP